MLAEHQSSARPRQQTRPFSSSAGLRIFFFVARDGFLTTRPRTEAPLVLSGHKTDSRGEIEIVALEDQSNL